MRRLLVTVCALAMAAQGGAVADEKKQEQPAVPDSLKKAVRGTDFNAEPGHNGKGWQLRTKKSWIENWDKDVISRACSWANFADPNLILEMEADGAGWKMKKVDSAADGWGRGNSPMEIVAKEYAGKAVTQESLILLGARMRVAYHKEFGDPPAEKPKK